MKKHILIGSVTFSALAALGFAAEDKYKSAAGFLHLTFNAIGKCV